jgi:hypothetical protein
MMMHDRPERIAECRIIKRDGVGMLKPGHQERFALETLTEFRVAGNLLVHHFDDDLPAKISLACEIDPAHTAFAEEASYLVAAQEDASDHERQWLPGR